MPSEIHEAPADEMRERFEAWAEPCLYGMSRDNGDEGRYSFPNTHAAWSAWQASAASFSEELSRLRAERDEARALLLAAERKETEEAWDTLQRKLQFLRDHDGVQLFDLCHLGSLARAYGDARAEAAEASLASLKRDGTSFDFIAYLARERAWSEETFGPHFHVRRNTDHIRKELVEIEASPYDLEEWVDVVILALDGAWRAGHDASSVVAMIEAKQTKNEGRRWPDWQTADPHAPAEHIRDDGEPAAQADHRERIVSQIASGPGGGDALAHYETGDSAAKRYGFERGGLQAAWRRGERTDRAEVVWAVIDALSMGGVAAWPGDATGCVANIIVSLLDRAEKAEAALGAPAPEDWQWVPKEPTEAMLNAIAHADWIGRKDLNWGDGYRIMLAAAPLPAPANPSEEA